MADQDRPPVAGVGTVPGALAPSGPVPWDAETLRPLFEQLIPSAEQFAVAQLTGKAAKADLPPAVLREIEKDARWSPPTKAALTLSGPQVAAKWLNKTGVSAENQAEVVLLTALAALVASHAMLSRKLDGFIADTRPAAPKPGQAPSPAANAN